VAEAFGVKRGLLSRVSPVKRATFVIDTDRTVLDVFSSEIRFEAHADRALDFLRSRAR
jgi:peroxiredoxin Q/BCP